VRRVRRERLDQLDGARQVRARLLQRTAPPSLFRALPVRAGGVLRFAIRGYLRQRKEKGEIAAFVNGESWSSFDDRSKLIFAKLPELVLDSDVGRGNKGITLVLL